MSDLQVVTTADRPDLDEQVSAAFRPAWPEFIFHDPVAKAHIDRVGDYFPRYDVLLLDGDRVAAGGWGVPLRWDGTASGLPADGYDGALIAAVTGHERATGADTLCIMAAAVRPDRQGSGLAGRVLTELRGRAASAGLQRVIAPVRPALKSRYPLARWPASPAGPGLTACTSTRGFVPISGSAPSSWPPRRGR